MPTGIVRFDSFELDTRVYELRRAGQVIRLERIPFDLLLLLVERRGELVVRDEIIERIWGKDIFLDTDNSINTAIRKIRRALGDDAEAPRFVITVPARGYRFVAQVDPSSPQPTSPPVTSPAPPRPMLVVLPFQNLSNDPAQEYFSDGLTEETIANLGEFASDALGVIARTSSMAYKQTRKTVAEIGRDLKADFAIEGSVRRSGDRVRITVQLIRTADQTHLWAHSYDRELKDLLAVQEELGRAIAQHVEGKLVEPARAGEVPHAMDQAAYESYLKGRFHLWKVRKPDIERAIEYFRHATQIDPRMAAAYAGLADSYDVLPITSDVRPGDAFPKAEQAALQALKLDADSAEAHCALASVRFWHSWDWAASEEHSRKALGRNASYARGHLRYGHLLSNIGRHEQAIAEIDIARELDPFSPIINTLCAQFRFQARRYDEVPSLLARTLEIEPRFWVGHILSAKFHLTQGRFEDALASAQRAHEFSGRNTEATALAGYAYAQMDRPAEAEKICAELKAIAARTYVPPYNIATVYLGLGDDEATMDWLEKAYLDRDVHMVFLAVEPKWDAVRSTPRFDSLLRHIGFPQPLLRG